MAADYSKLDDDMFDGILRDIVTLPMLWAVPGVHELAAEHYNNEVLTKFEQDNPGLAFPKEEDE